MFGRPLCGLNSGMLIFLGRSYNGASLYGTLAVEHDISQTCLVKEQFLHLLPSFVVQERPDAGVQELLVFPDILTDCLQTRQFEQAGYVDDIIKTAISVVLVLQCRYA